MCYVPSYEGTGEVQECEKIFRTCNRYVPALNERLRASVSMLVEARPGRLMDQTWQPAGSTTAFNCLQKRHGGGRAVRGRFSSLLYALGIENKIRGRREDVRTLMQVHAGSPLVGGLLAGWCPDHLLRIPRSSTRQEEGPV
jgi:hypothetical protein